MSLKFYTTRASDFVDWNLAEEESRLVGAKRVPLRLGSFGEPVRGVFYSMRGVGLSLMVGRVKFDGGKICGFSMSRLRCSLDIFD